MLRAIDPDGEPRRNPRIAGTIESSNIVFKLAFARILPNISEVPEAKVTFFNSKAPKAAKVTSHNALFFKILLQVIIVILWKIKIVNNPINVANAIFTFSTAARITVIVIGKKE